MWHKLWKEREKVYSPSSLVELSMITKTGVYNQKREFKNIYYQNWAFMKLKEKVHMYSQHIARIQWSEWTTVWGGTY